MEPTHEEKKREYYLSAVDPQLGVIASDPAILGVDDHTFDEEQFPKHLNADDLVSNISLLYSLCLSIKSFISYWVYCVGCE